MADQTSKLPQAGEVFERDGVRWSIDQVLPRLRGTRFCESEPNRPDVVWVSDDAGELCFIDNWLAWAADAQEVRGGAE